MAEYIGMKELVEQLQVDRNSVYRFISAGRIKPIGKAGKEWRFAPDTAEKFMQAETKRSKK